jgi:hypothetical protein
MVTMAQIRRDAAAIDKATREKKPRAPPPKKKAEPASTQAGPANAQADSRPSNFPKPKPAQKIGPITCHDPTAVFVVMRNGLVAHECRDVIAAREMERKVGQGAAIFLRSDGTRITHGPGRVSHDEVEFLARATAG